MADTPSEDAEHPAAPKPARRRAAKEGAAPKPRARRAKAPPPESSTDKVKRTARSAVEGATRTVARAEKAVGKVARTARTKAGKAAEPVANRKVALGAAAAVGVAAGLAAAFVGRKRIARTATDVIDSVTGTVSERNDGPAGNPPASRAN